MEEIIPKSEDVGEYKESKRRLLRAKKILYAVIAVLVLIIILGSLGGYKMHLNYLNNEIESKDSLQNELDIRGIQYEKNYKASLERIDKIDELEDIHKKGFIKYKQKDDDTKKQLIDINNLDTPYPRLDSLAENIKFQ